MVAGSQPTGLGIWEPGGVCPGWGVLQTVLVSSMSSLEGRRVEAAERWLTCHSQPRTRGLCACWVTGAQTCHRQNQYQTEPDHVTHLCPGFLFCERSPAGLAGPSPAPVPPQGTLSAGGVGGGKCRLSSPGSRLCNRGVPAQSFLGSEPQEAGERQRSRMDERKS